MEHSHDGVVDRAYEHLVKNYNGKKNNLNTARVIKDLIFRIKKTTFK